MTKLILSFEDFHEISYDSATQHYFMDNVGIRDSSIRLNNNYLKGVFNEIISDNFSIKYGRSNFLHPAIVLFESKEKIIKMFFTLKGVSTLFTDDSQQNFSVQEGFHNIFYGSETKGKVIWKTLNTFTFEIILKPAFFTIFLPENAVFNRFKYCIKQNKFATLSPQNQSITPEMIIIINSIINCNLKEGFRKLFLESKVFELLLLQLEQIAIYGTQTINKKKNTLYHHKDKMYYIKDYITKNLYKNLSLKELAKEIQSNECTLKKEFKSIFGTTVFGYIRKQRMKQAKQMLLTSENTTVKQVAELIGYKNPQHFSTAFKKHFGSSPKNFLQK